MQPVSDRRDKSTVTNGMQPVLGGVGDKAREAKRF